MIPLEDYFNGIKSNTFKHGDIFDVDNVKVVLLENGTHVYTVYDTLTWERGTSLACSTEIITLDNIQYMLPPSLSKSKATPHKWTPNSVHVGQVLQNRDLYDTFMLTRHKGQFALTNLSTGRAIDGELYSKPDTIQDAISKEEWLEWKPLNSGLKHWYIASDEQVLIG